MIVRQLKIVLVVFTGLLCLGYAGHNLVNLGPAHHFVAAVLSMEGHEAYPASFMPVVTAPLLVWIALAVIIALELAAAACALYGAWRLWCARLAPAAAFDAAKEWALLGCGLALVVWFGLFAVLGGAFYQMWQTELGANALAGAFQYAVQAGIVLLFVNMREEGGSS